MFKMASTANERFVQVFMLEKDAASDYRLAYLPHSKNYQANFTGTVTYMASESAACSWPVSLYDRSAKATLLSELHPRGTTNISRRYLYEVPVGGGKVVTIETTYNPWIY